MKYNPTVVNHLEKKYGLSKVYIRRCLGGKQVGIQPDTIRKDYDTLELKVNQKVNEALAAN